MQCLYCGWMGELDPQKMRLEHELLTMKWQMKQRVSSLWPPTILEEVIKFMDHGFQAQLQAYKGGFQSSVLYCKLHPISPPNSTWTILQGVSEWRGVTETLLLLLRTIVQVSLGQDMTAHVTWPGQCQSVTTSSPQGEQVLVCITSAPQCVQ